MSPVPHQSCGEDITFEQRELAVHQRELGLSNLSKTENVAL